MQGVGEAPLSYTHLHLAGKYQLPCIKMLITIILISKCPLYLCFQLDKIMCRTARYFSFQFLSVFLLTEVNLKIIQSHRAVFILSVVKPKPK